MPIDFNAVASLLGNIASIAGIPLAIWLYLRGGEDKEYSTRREITHILSFQLGEGRPLSRFEVRAVTASLLRRRKLKAATISTLSIVNDLVCETLANPMLPPDRKKAILGELEEIISSHSKEASDPSSVEPSEPRVTPTMQDEIEAEARGKNRASNIFGVAATIGLAFGIYLLPWISALDLARNFENFDSLFVSAGASLIGSAIYALLRTREDDRSKHENIITVDADQGSERK